MIALTLAGTLIDLQLKLILNATFGGDDIAAIYGYMSVAIGIGTLLLQLWASRMLFPKLGVSFAAKMHGGPRRSRLSPSWVGQPSRRWQPCSIVVSCPFRRGEPS